MSDLTKQQFVDTFNRLRAAVDDVHSKDDLTDKRIALQDVISLCDAFKASSVGYSSALGYAKRESDLHKDRPRPNGKPRGP